MCSLPYSYFYSYSSPSSYPSQPTISTTTHKYSHPYKYPHLTNTTPRRQSLNSAFGYYTYKSTFQNSNSNSNPPTPSIKLTRFLQHIGRRWPIQSNIAIVLSVWVAVIGPLVYAEYRERRREEREERERVMEREREDCGDGFQ
jgi:hypothetical protein